MIQFYPSKFVLITDILDTFGKLVFERLRDKAQYIPPGSGVPIKLPGNSRDTTKDGFSDQCFSIFEIIIFLAHLSRRLIGELIGYSWSVVRPSSVRPSSFTILKNLLRNRFANQSQILCGASLGRGNDILFAASGSHDQDGCHTHLW